MITHPNHAIYSVMSNITNKHNLPQTLVNLAMRDTYSRGSAKISVTELIGSPKIRILRQEKRSEIVSDVSDMLWSLLGRAMHLVVEQGADEAHIAEERLFTEVAGWVISGGVDLQIIGKDASGGVTVGVSDYKTTTAWAVMNPKLDWERQLNCYAYLIEKVRGWTVTELTINAIVRDWNRHEATRRPDYPATPLVVLPQNLWTPEQREAYVLERIKAHQAAETAFDFQDPMPDCSEEERWFRPGKLAVMKEGRVRALKLFNTAEKDEAEQYAKGNKGYVEERRGENARCEGYCPVSKWCSQFASLQQDKEA